MVARGRTPRDDRRREYGQNFLADPAVVRRFLARADLTRDDLVVEFGAGIGALTLPLARAGARVLAVERDPAWARGLRDRVRAAGLQGRVQVVQADLRRVPLPDRRYRVISNPPFGLTTALLALLLDDPREGRGVPTCSCSGRSRSSAPRPLRPRCGRPRGRPGGGSSWATR